MKIYNILIILLSLIIFTSCFSAPKCFLITDENTKEQTILKFNNIRFKSHRIENISGINIHTIIIDVDEDHYFYCGNFSLKEINCR